MKATSCAACGSSDDVLSPPSGNSGEFELLDIHPTGIIGEVFGGEIGNAKELYSGTLTGPGANQSTKTPGESETFSGTVSLLAGQTLTFAVNRDGNFGADSTGLTATITSLALGAPTASSVPDNDGSGHILVSYAATPASVAASEVGGGSSADLLGRYGSAFAEPPSTPTRDALAFDAWTALGSSAGAYSGGFDFHHDGNAGGARDAWGVGLGEHSPIGHGPGS